MNVVRVRCLLCGDQFCVLMASGALTLLPAPAATEAERLANFEAATKTVKASSPVLAIFKKVASHDASLTALELSGTIAHINAEFAMSWPDQRKSAALGLLCGSPFVTHVNLIGCNLSDKPARAIAMALGAGSVVQVLNLERNRLGEVGLLEIARGLQENTSLRELRLTGNTITTAVQVAFAELLDGGGASGLTILSPPCRNANEDRRVQAALARNMDALRKRRNEAAKNERV